MIVFRNNATVTMNEIIDKSTNENIPLLQIANYQQFFNSDFMKEYKTNYGIFDGYFKTKYGDFEKRFTNLTDFDIIFSTVQRELISALAVNAYEFNGLYDSMHLKYDPMVNYDVTEERKRTRTPKLDKTIEKSDLLGERTDIVTPDSIVENKVAPFNSSNYVESEQTTQSGTTTSKTGSQSNTQTMLISDKGNEEVVESNRMFGDLGVQSAMDRVVKQRNILYFEYYDILFSKLLYYTGWNYVKGVFE